MDITRVVISLILGLVFFSFFHAGATHLFAVEEKFVADPVYYGFYGPNEVYPYRVKKDFSKTPKGLGISVGTERGFIHASYANLDHLLLIDIDPMVVKYNKANIALLKISRSLEEFRYLKTQASFDAWLQADEKLMGNDPLKGALKNYEVYQVYHLLLNEHSFYANLVKQKQLNVERNLEIKKVKLSEDLTVLIYKSKLYGETFFKEGNYHFDNDLFWKLKKLADQNKIEAVNVDLAHHDFFVSLQSKLTKRQMKISYFDLSNAWWGEYTNLNYISYFVNQLKPNYQSATKFILTSIYIHSDDLKDKYKLWQYHFLSPSVMEFVFKNSFINRLTKEYFYYSDKLKRFGGKATKCVTELIEKNK